MRGSSTAERVDLTGERLRDRWPDPRGEREGSFSVAVLIALIVIVVVAQVNAWSNKAPYVTDFGHRVEHRSTTVL